MSLLSSISFRVGRWRALRVAERGLPPLSAQVERENAELKMQFAELPVVAASNVASTEADWNSAMNRLRELGSSADPRAFQRWDVIIARMAHTGSPATAVELAALKADAAWESRWKPALTEISAGRPVPYEHYPASSEVLIQTVHNVFRLEMLSGCKVSEWDTVVEFGGGFGGMCRVMHALGFSGQYLLFDLAPFSILQRYYLREAGLMGGGSKARVRITSDYSELERFVMSIPENARAAFWATWSISEVPVSLRERIKPLASRVGHYCLAFQGRYGEVDNIAYFTRQWLSSDARLECIEHRPDDYYLAGKSVNGAEVPASPFPSASRGERSGK